MYLKAIELENFKSFVHKNRIEFKPGFTAISGPNGSGKSNLGDAILFVLGPKSSKVIRANKLTDLIYDGGKTGKKADFCRVSLIFDNTDRVLPIDTNEVKLTRYVKRTGTDGGYVSYFYINDEKARLQDFASLLEHAKIDADGYNFVRQGDITRIVEMSPVERRQILEDIAGISEFDRDIARAEEKKRVVEENMGKIEVRMEEIKSRVEELRRDREIALRYKNLEEELRETRAKIAYARMVEARENMDSYARELESYDNEISKLQAEIEAIEREMAALEEERENIERKIGELGGKELEEMRRRIDEIKIEYARLKSRVEDREERIKENEKRVAELRKLIKEKKAQLKVKNEELESLNREISSRRKMLSERESRLNSLERDMEEKNRSFREAHETMKKMTDELEQVRKEYNARLLEYNKAKEKIASLNREIARIEEEKKSVEEGIRDAEWRIKEVKEKTRGVENKRRALNSKYMELKNRQSRLRKELEEKQKRINALNEEYHRLKGKMESSDPLSAAVNAILSARDTGELRGIYGTIAELGRVDEKYELAIQIAAGNRLLSIVCEDDESAARAIEYLKRNRLGRAIFLPLNKMLSGRPRGRAILASKDPKSHGFAIDLMKFDKKFEAAFWYVFGDTVVVEDLSTARKLMGGVRLVTLDGQLIEASGAMVGGSVARRKKIAMGNVNEIAEQIRNLRAERDAIEASLHEVEREIDALLEQINSLGGGSTEDVVVWTRERDRLKESLARIVKNLNDKYREKEGLESIVRSLSGEIEEKSKIIDALQAKIDSLQDEIDKMVSDEKNAEISALREEISKLRGELESLLSRKNELSAELSTIRNELAGAEQRINELLKENEEMRRKNEDAGKEMEALMVERRKYEDIVSREEQQIAELVKQSDALQREISKKRELLVQRKADIQTKESLKISLAAKRKEAEERYQEARTTYEGFGIQVSEVGSIRALRRRESDLEVQIQALGDVNLKSIDEYERESQRYESLREDYDTLVREKKEIETLVKELNTKKKEGLLKVFRAINDNMRKIYHELSNGGDAYLVLENEEDPFKGGLIIKVKPPGKGIKRLDALSGGEKSLTALAFIFAIQQYEPSPIYLLDEVDMFLDGVNAEVVGRVIKRNASSAQFIVISLRKATLKFAENIIGVTQRGDGISRVYLQPVLGEVSENA
ncbi:MAG: chromosome segregation protein SMC [Euryarchaeota archaeon]|nr:chromosome segregation protein SMC [Euryarchaeota archaeon]